MLIPDGAYDRMMRRIAAGLAVAAALWVAAAPASAHQVARDPFDPLVVPNTGGGGVVTGAEPVVPIPVAPAPDEPLPQTGTSPEPWLAGAYFLVATGAGLVALGRVAR